MTSRFKLYRLITAAMFLALALVLPFITGQLQQIGKALCPMHIPIILCGFFCGPVYAGVIGFAAPLLRFFMFGMPPIIPSGIAMCFELMTYGVIAGLLYKFLPKNKISIFVSLISSMVSGRIIWGIVMTILNGLGKCNFGFTAFISGAFLNAIPGIIVQLIVIPVLIISLEKFTIKNKQG